MVGVSDRKAEKGSKPYESVLRTYYYGELNKKGFEERVDRYPEPSIFQELGIPLIYIEARWKSPEESKTLGVTQAEF